MMVTIAHLLSATALPHLIHALLGQAQLATTIPTGVDYMRILPELILAIFGMIVMVVDPLLDPDSSHESLGTIALTGALAALASTFWMARYPGVSFWNMIRVEPFSVFFHVLVIAIAVVAILSSFEYLKVQRIRAGEYYVRHSWNVPDVVRPGTRADLYRARNLLDCNLHSRRV
jgi:hypothetical protein